MRRSTTTRKGAATWCLAATLLGAALIGGPARAQPSVALLRHRLERLGQSALPEATRLGVQHTLGVAASLAVSQPAQGQAWRERVAWMLQRLRRGADPYLEADGRISLRAYRSPLSELPQGYALYLPRGYDPSRAYPLLVVLHGGSSNGNLFLGVTLGNDVGWKDYVDRRWELFTPQHHPEWIVVAPDGFGHVLWRWMGERDVLDVIDDVRRHYHVDPDRVVLAGLSNGGLGAYSVGMRHAWRFSAVVPMAGAPSWIRYSPVAPAPAEATAMRAWSALDLADNAAGTSLKPFHGRFDPGPMRPAYVEELALRLVSLGVPHEVTWYPLGHDVLARAMAGGALLDRLAAVRRPGAPDDVRLVTGDYRASRQHWLTVTRRSRHEALTSVRGRVAGSEVTVTTDNAAALTVHVGDLPATPNDRFALVVDGARLYDGPRAAFGSLVPLVRDERGWRMGTPQSRVPFSKRPRLSGPLTDAYFDPMVHVYGTARPEHTRALRALAADGAAGVPAGVEGLSQRVLADVELDEAVMRGHHVVLYGAPGDNLALDRIAAELPIRADAAGVALGSRRFDGALGVRFIHPNPLAPGRYVIVQSGTDLPAVRAGAHLPDFLPDYVIYDGKRLARRSRLVLGADPAVVAQGYLDADWSATSSDEEDPARGVERPGTGRDTMRP